MVHENGPWDWVTEGYGQCYQYYILAKGKSPTRSLSDDPDAATLNLSLHLHPFENALENFTIL